jgi:ABC-type polysaccharide/polyol phosphate export permease
VVACASSVNPLTYQVEALRYLMIPHRVWDMGFDLLVQLLALAVLTAVVAKLYPTTIR